MHSRRERCEGESGVSFSVAGVGAFLVGASWVGASLKGRALCLRGGGFWSWRERRSGR